MRFINVVLNAACDLVLKPWCGESAWPPLIAASLVAAALLVGLFRISADPTAILRQRNRLIARVLELLLFRHDFRMSLTACGRIVTANLRYLREFVKPMLVSAVPVSLLFVQLGCWFDARPLRVGEAVLLEIEMDESFPVMETQIELTVSDGLKVETDAVRIPATNDCCWRLLALEETAGRATVRVGELELDKQVSVGRRVARVSSRRPRGFWQQLLHPSEPPLAADAPLVRIDVGYPARQLLVGVSEVNWLVACVIFIMIFGLVLGRFVGVRLG